MDDLFSLKGHRALITGAAGGLGTHFAQTLAAAGAEVVLAGRRLQPLQQLQKTLAAQGATAHAVAMDVTQADSIRSALDDVEHALGLVDIVVCNAGSAITKPALDLSPGEWDTILDVNLKGCWQVSTEAARRLVAAGTPGSIVHISSILGHRVAGAVLPYTVSKAGLEQMTRALALEWARYGIRVNALAPGYIETDLNRDFFKTESGQNMVRRIPQRRLGALRDLDGALLLLASDASRYMTGASIVVDGGHLQSTL